MSGAPASAKIAMTSPVTAEMGAGEYKVREGGGVLRACACLPVAQACTVQQAAA